jgi:hypothetical protein
MYTDWGVISLLIAGIVGFFVAIPSFIYHYRKKLGEWFNAKFRKRNKS